MRRVSLASLFVLVLLICESSGILQITTTFTNSGTIVEAPIGSSISEIRGMFLHKWWWRITDVNAVLDTCQNGGINTVVLESYPDIFFNSTGQLVHWSILDTLADGIHARGMKAWVLLTVGLSDKLARNTGWDMLCILADGSTYDWLAPTKPDSRSAMLMIAESLARDYDIDGFMFDYIRYDSSVRIGLMSFDSYSKDKFIADTGLVDVNWPTDCLSDGRYYRNFIEWRTIPITELVHDMRTTMLNYKPDMKFSAAVFQPWADQTTWNILNVGQHTSDWVAKGYLDYVVPMIYTDKVIGEGSITDCLTSAQKYFVGAREDWYENASATPAPRKGAIPLLLFISQEFGANVTVFAQQVDVIRSLNSDGFIIWRYEGPGLGGENGPYDVRQYLSALPMPPTFSIVSVGFDILDDGSSATITWTTTAPSTSKVEYKNAILFNGTLKVGDQYGRVFEWVDVDYSGNSSIIEDVGLQMNHQITIPLNGTTYFRVQSMDSQGLTVTTKVYSIIPLP
jgi:hypothetical protein